MSQDTLVPSRPLPMNRSGALRYRISTAVKTTAGYAVLVFTVMISLYPIFVMLLNSFKSDSEVSRNPAGLPQTWTLASYAAIFEYHGGLWVNFLNSVIIATTSTVVALFVVSLAAFAFAKYRFAGRNLIFAMLLATMMVPGEITIPPLYLMFARMGWLNTYQVQILPTIMTVFGLFLVRQYMLEIPDALIEAARIDGAGHWQIYTSIMIPTSAPILGAFAILHFQGVWNAYLWPLVVATDRAVQPIMVVLPNLTDPIIGYLPVWGTIMAGTVLSTLPIVIVFIAFQDKFMSSVTIGAVKE